MTIFNSRIMSLGGPSFYLPTPLDSPWYLSGGISAANCVAAYQPKGAASLAVSYTNLANPGTYTAAPGVAPTWDATNGWVLNGTTQYLTTGVVPSDGNWSAIVRFSSLLGGNGFVFGIRQTSPTQFGFHVKDSSPTEYASGSTPFLLGSALVTPGVYAIAGKGYKNGVADSLSLTSGSGNLRSLYIGARNLDGSVSGFCSVKIQALAVYNIVLSASQVLAVTNAMNAL